VFARLHEHPEYTLPVPELGTGWTQLLAGLVGSLLLRVMGREHVTPVDVLYVWRRVCRWCQLLAITSPTLVATGLPAGHALAAYILLLAPRRWSAAVGSRGDAQGWTIMPPDVVVGRTDLFGDDTETRWIQAIFPDPEEWKRPAARRQHVASLAATAAAAAKKKQKKKKRPRDDSPHGAGAHDDTEMEAMDDMRRAMFSVGDRTVLPATPESSSSSRRTWTPTMIPYHSEGDVTRVQVENAGESLAAAYARCTHAPAWLHGFFIMCA